MGAAFDIKKHVLQDQQRIKCSRGTFPFHLATAFVCLTVGFGILPRQATFVIAETSAPWTIFSSNLRGVPMIGRRKINSSSKNNVVSNNSGVNSRFRTYDPLTKFGSVLANTSKKRKTRTIATKRTAGNIDQGNKIKDGSLADVKDEQVLSMEEMRAKLNPFEKLILGTIEVGTVTAGSFLSGGFLGYSLGGLGGIPALFRNNPEVSGVGAKIAGLHKNAVGKAGSWGQVSAAFSGFHALSRVVRGGREDKWNGVIGSFATGCYFSRKSGPQAMIQGGASYAGITYLLDTLLSGGGNRQKGAEFDYSDTPILES